MPADRSFRKNAATVTVGLLDGSVKGGRMGLFSPPSTDLAVDVPSRARDGEERSVRVFFATENVAFVGFHREPEDPPGRSTGAASFRVHVAGGRKFAVELDVRELGDALGYYGTPIEGDSPYREVFFYAHGVNAKENSEAIGSMLIRQGVIAPVALARGIQSQVAERGTPLGQILVEQGTISAEAAEEAASLQKRRRLRIGEVLVEAGLASAQDIDNALAEQKKRGGKKIGEVLVEMGILTEVDLALTLATKFSLPFVNLDEYPIDPQAARSVPRELIEKYGVLPVGTDARGITIAISDPLATETIDDLRFNIKRRIHEVLATPSQLKKFVRAFLESGDRPAEEFERILKQLAAEDAAPAAAATAGKDDGASDSAVIKLVNQVIIDAYRRGASDIHIEPNGDERSAGVRFRIDGDCVAYQEVPAAFRLPLVARLKIMAALDISERRKPQDGKIRFKFQDKTIELRVATLPTVNGNEDVVMRILAGSKPLPIDKMSLSERNLRELRRISAQPYGLILCVGPTGSGKTTTLHSVLGSINTPDMKILTAEDPVEITQAGLRQVQVQPKIGFTFAAAMRAFLRSDPDVIMVGEMRDEETAGTAVEASLTGHLVFSTLHTNTAPETITRLLDMGIDRFSFSDALLGVLAQRLARSLCRKCAEPIESTRAEYATIAGAMGEAWVAARGPTAGDALPLWRAKGCEACGGSGYKGRVGLHELLVNDDEVKAAIQNRAAVDEIRRTAMRNGMTTLLQDGLAKALAGQTDLKQVLAVCSR